MFDFMPLAGSNHGEDLVLLLAALAFDFLLGLVPCLAGLVPGWLRVFSGVARFFDRRLNRAGRSETNLRVRGAMVTIVVVVIALVAGFAFHRAARLLPYGWVAEFVVLAMCLSARRIFRDLRHGLRVLGGDKLAVSQAFVGQLTGRDASRLDKFGVARNIIEFAAVAVGR